MKRFKLGFGNRTVLEQIAICRRVVGGIGKLPAKQRQALAELPVAASLAAAEEACAEVTFLKTTLRAALAQRNAMMADLRDHTTRAAIAISLATNGEPAAMLAAGVGIVKDKQPVGRPGAPTWLRSLAPDFEGAVRLRWKRPVRRCTFVIQLTTAPAATRGWKQAHVCVKQTCTVNGLVSGKKYWFRVAAVNAHGQGPWSQPVNVRVK